VLKSFAINAGGDVSVQARPGGRDNWRVGIRHPRLPDGAISLLELQSGCVCTSGDYERKQAVGNGHHIVNPMSWLSPDGVASASVVAPSAMLADALSTAVFVLGASRGLRLLQQQQVEGLMVTSELACHATPGYAALTVAS
jgi:thiamine biosynthesis lipoprotein